MASIMPRPHGQKVPEKKIRILLSEEGREEARQAKPPDVYTDAKGMNIPWRILSIVSNTIQRSSKMATKNSHRI